jgi:hypothetical protein
MTREVYTDKSVIEFSRKQVFLRVFQDTEPEGDRLARKFGVRGFPTIIVLDSKGNEIDRIFGERSAPELIEELNAIFESASPGKSPVIVQRFMRAGPETAGESLSKNRRGQAAASPA